MFKYPALWEEIGYDVKSGNLAKGEQVTLERTAETSPSFLEAHSTIDDLVLFKKFDNEDQQNEWLAQQINENLTTDELRHDDVIVIHPDPISARRRTGPIRKLLFDQGIQAHLAGVDTDADVFFKTDTQSVTFTGIFRAKGNEAGMVYVINAQDCNGIGTGLSSIRNRLFTAITRSKAWVRVIGYGPSMQDLINEFNTLKGSGFVLDFTYPDDELQSKLQLVHRDVSLQEKQRLQKNNSDLANLIGGLEKGDVLPEDFDPELRERLKRFFGNN